MQLEITFEQLEKEMKKQGFTKLALVFIDSTHSGEYRWNWRWLANIDEREINATCERFKIDRQSSERKMLMGGYLIN